MDNFKGAVSLCMATQATQVARRPLAMVQDNVPQYARSKMLRSSSAAPLTAAGETNLFLAFVQMLAAKSPEERQMLAQAALQEAHGAGGAAVESGAVGRGLRRSHSASEVRKTNLVARYGPQPRTAGAGVYSSLRGPACALDARPHSAETAAGSLGWAAHQARALKQKQGGRLMHLTQAQVQAQMHQQFCRRWAATTLQAHWRGWQHRRFIRFLRARRKRHRRLSYLWELDYTHKLLIAHSACTFIQARWRAYVDLKHAQRSRSAQGDPAEKMAAVDWSTFFSGSMASEASSEGGALAAAFVAKATNISAETIGSEGPVSEAFGSEGLGSEGSEPEGAGSGEMCALQAQPAAPQPPGMRRSLSWKEEIAEVCPFPPRPHAPSQAPTPPSPHTPIPSS